METTISEKKILETKIYVPDISCESCVRLISRKAKAIRGVGAIRHSDEAVIISHDENVRPQELISAIKGLGFRASVEPFEYKTLSERLRDMRENKTKYVTERRMLLYAVLTFISLVIIEGIAYVGLFSRMPGFLGRYGLWLIYLDVSVVAIAIAVWHVLSYRAKVSCMVGMMVGMTFGMQSGMMVGAVVGATSGFFVGAMSGMVLGVIVGALMGKCCGVMGVMEGMMAGLMGGTMGPMVSVMMVNDHLKVFMPIYMVVNLLIMAGLSYMFVQEVVEKERCEKRSIDFITLAAATVLITAAMVAIMVYGPKSALFGG